jgi:VIT1/CCC1 family predicted Fe2+/Mn2+ transporter
MAMLDFIGKWKDKIAEYADARIQVVKLELVERVSKVLSFFTFIIACFLLVLPMLLFMSMATAEFFADLMGSRSGGYYLITGIYLVLLSALYIYRKSFIRKFTDLFVKVMTDSDDDDEQPDSK